MSCVDKTLENAKCTAYRTENTETSGDTKLEKHLNKMKNVCVLFYLFKN